MLRLRHIHVHPTNIVTSEIRPPCLAIPLRYPRHNCSICELKELFLDQPLSWGFGEFELNSGRPKSREINEIIAGFLINNFAHDLQISMVTIENGDDKNHFVDTAITILHLLSALVK
uniref:Uncharacterized protein n=1 Tax=Onchocerca volvulus TaxID=6282 RepID=A0A8R1TWM5_ONCVO